jgi:hypothetical protein
VFPVTFPNIEIEKTVTDEEIDEHNARLLKATEFEYLIEPETERVFIETQKEELTAEQKAFLFDAYTRPYLSIKERMGSINL